MSRSYLSNEQRLIAHMEALTLAEPAQPELYVLRNYAQPSRRRIHTIKAEATPPTPAQQEIIEAFRARKIANKLKTAARIK